MQRMFILTIAILCAVLPITHAKGSFLLDGNQLLQRCLPKPKHGGSHSPFCAGYISGVLHMAESSKEVCQVSDRYEIKEIIEVVREALELNYQYRSRPAQDWVLRTVKNSFCN